MIKKLLIGMFLWLPLLYTVLFIVISLFTETIGGNWGFYFVGLSVCLAACVALTYIYAHRSDTQTPADERTEVRDIPAPRLPVNEEDEINTRDEANRYAAEMKAGPSAVGGERYDGSGERSAYLAGGRYVDPAPAPDPVSSPDALRSSDALMGASGMNDYYYGSGRSSQPRRTSGDSDFSPYVQPSNYGGADGISLDDYDETRLRGSDPALSADPPSVPAPRIFRLRGEPNVLLYEYPTEYRKYYVNADGSLRLLSTQKKE